MVSVTPPMAALRTQTVGILTVLDSRQSRSAGTVALIDRRARFAALVSGARSDHSGELIESGR